MLAQEENFTINDSEGEEGQVYSSEEEDVSQDHKDEAVAKEASDTEECELAYEAHDTSGDDEEYIQEEPSLSNNEEVYEFGDEAQDTFGKEEAPDEDNLPYLNLTDILTDVHTFTVPIEWRQQQCQNLQTFDEL